MSALSTFEQVELQKKLDQSSKEIERLNALVAMQAEALKECKSDLFYQIESKHGAKAASSYPSIIQANEALSASSETVAKWEAEKLLPLQRQIASIYKAFNFAIEMAREGDDSDIKAAHQKVVEAISNTQATAEAYDREHDVKVLEEAKSNIETMNAQMRIDIQDVVDALQQMADECRATKQVKE